MQRINAFNLTADRPFVLGHQPAVLNSNVSRAVRLHQTGEPSFAHVVTFNMDEYVGLAADHPECYRVHAS